MTEWTEENRYFPILGSILIQKPLRRGSISSDCPIIKRALGIKEQYRKQTAVLTGILRHILEWCEKSWQQFQLVKRT